MAIAKKPKPNVVSEKEVEAVISKGGSVVSETSGKLKQSARGEQAVIVRVPAEMLSIIDERVGKRRIKTSRHTWLLEAILEKLDNEAV